MEQINDPKLLRDKKRKLAYIKGIIFLIVIVALGITLKTLAKRAQENKNRSFSQVDEKVLNGQIEQGEIQDAIYSSGSIASADEVNIEIPGKISVLKYYVSAGDTLQAGDKIAAVDRNSVLAAIADLEDLIGELDDEVSDVIDDSVSSTMKASVAGRVVKIYAQADNTVVDTMYQHGALMLISLDDLYAIDIDNNGSLAVGDTVSVKKSDGTIVDGKVAGVEKESVTITVDLADFDFEESVQVLDASKNKLGEGALYIYSQQKITGFSGKISSVNVSEGNKVSEGSSLLTLADTDYTADYQMLLKKRNKLVEQYNTLNEISQSGYLVAKEDGMVTAIDESLKNTTPVQRVSDSTRKNGGSGFLRTSATSGTKVMSFVKVTSQGEENPTNTPEELPPENEPTDDPANQPTEATEAPESSEKTTAEKEKKTEEKTEEATKPEEKPAQTQTVTEKTVKVKWLDSKGKEITKNLPKSQKITLNADGKKVAEYELVEKEKWEHTFTELPVYNGNILISYTVQADVPSGYVGSYKVDGNTIVLEFTQSSGTSGSNTPGGTTPDGQNTDGKNNSQQSPNGTDQNANNGKTPSNDSSNGGVPGGAPSGGTPSGGVTGSFSDGTTMTAQVPTQEEETYSFESTSLGTYIPNDEVSVDITIDELDIRKISKDMEAEVTLDALPGKTFQAKVNEIDINGTNEGGNTKYTVNLLMEKTEDMLLGMNVSVALPLAVETNVSTIPVEALVEKEGKTYVYTSYDEKKEELGDLVEVETGLSDGFNVEIVSGLEDNQTFYYKYADSISYQFFKR